MIDTIKKRSIFIFLLHFFIAISQANSQSLQGPRLTEYIQEQLTFWGTEYTKQELTPSSSGSFSSNLIVTFPARKEYGQNPIHNIVFALTQNFFVTHETLLHSFFEYLKTADFSYNAVILISTSDETYIFDRQSFPALSGTRVYASSIYETAGYAAVCLCDGENRKPFVISGGGGDVSPWWLVYSINRAFSANGKNCQVPHPFLYRNYLQISGEDSRVASFISREIPAAGAFVCNSDENILRGIAENIENQRTSHWAKNYIYFPHLFSGIFVGEPAFIALFLVASIIILGSLSFISIVDNSANSAALKDLQRTLYIIPATILLTFAVLTFISLVFSFTDNHPFLILGIKVSCVTALFMVIYIQQIKHKFFVSLSASSYHIIIVAALNIFIFSAINLALMIVYLPLYLIALIISRQNKSGLVIFLSALYLSLTGFFYLHMLSYAEWNSLTFFLRSTRITDLLIALSLYPLLTAFFRLTISLRIVDTFDSSSTDSFASHLKYILAVTLSVAVFYTVFVNAVFSKSEDSGYHFLDTTFRETQDFEIKNSCSEFYGMKTQRLMVSSEKDIIRYDVFITNEKEIPIYESNFDFTYSTDSTVHLTIPDFPPKNFEIIYSADTNSDESLRIDAYFVENGVLLHERYEQ